MQLPFCFFGTLCTAEGRTLLPASPCYETNIKNAGGPCQMYNGGQNGGLARIFYTLFVKKTVNKRRGIEILRSFVNP